eukprot:gene26976-32591_t
MNTLTGIEAERVNQILKHAIDRLQIMSYIPMAWDDDTVVDIKCPPVLSSLEKLWMCEEQLKEIDMSMGATGIKDIAILKQAHRSCRAACRNFIADKSSLEVIMGRPESQSEDFSKFLGYLNELRSQVMTKLSTTVEDEANNRNLLHDLTERERKYEESRDMLQGKLSELREEKQQVCNSLDTILRKLQHELHEITLQNTLEMESVQKEMNEAINKATADHELRMRQLQDRLDSMERQVSEVVERNKEEEQRMRREKGRLENILNAKVLQFDEDMTARQAALTTLQTSYGEELAAYSKLKEHFDKIDADIARFNEEEHILSCVERRAQFGFGLVNRAAVQIQKIYRGRRDREIVNKMKAKMKKKGKKGKKDKK